MTLTGQSGLDLVFCICHGFDSLVKVVSSSSLDLVMASARLSKGNLPSGLDLVMAVTRQPRWFDW